LSRRDDLLTTALARIVELEAKLKAAEVVVAAADDVKNNFFTAVYPDICVRRLLDALKTYREVKTDG